jgi:hypothetical protein
MWATARFTRTNGDVGYFLDGNEVIWHVFVEDGEVRYKIFDDSE